MIKNKTHITLNIDDLVINLVCEYHNKTHSEVMLYFSDLIESAIQCEGNIANNRVYPKKLFVKNGKQIFNTVKRVPPVKEIVTYPWGSPFTVETDDGIPPNIWVIRGFYPDTKIPFKLSIIQNGIESEHSSPRYFSNVTIGDKTKKSNINMYALDKYNSEYVDAILLDKDLKEIKQIPFEKKTFRCMRPKGMPLLKKAK